MFLFVKTDNFTEYNKISKQLQRDGWNSENSNHSHRIKKPTKSGKINRAKSNDKKYNQRLGKGIKGLSS